MCSDDLFVAVESYIAIALVDLLSTLLTPLLLAMLESMGWRERESMEVGV